VGDGARVVLHALSIGVLMLFSGCYRVSQYSGDGTLVDNGLLSATDRYVLNLGPVDLTRRGTMSYRIADLPEANFVVGIEIVTTSGPRSTTEKQLAPLIIALKLTGPGASTLFSKKSVLGEWIWSEPRDGNRAFVYWREGEGTFFNASQNSQYILTLDVLEPDRSQSKYVASLVAKSGGWK
jgi:hypothetical protein